jgi:hypothetical protein
MNYTNESFHKWRPLIFFYAAFYLTDSFCACLSVCSSLIIWFLPGIFIFQFLILSPFLFLCNFLLFYLHILLSLMLCLHPCSSYFLPYSHSFDNFCSLLSVPKRYLSSNRNAKRTPGARVSFSSETWRSQVRQLTALGAVFGSSIARPCHFSNDDYG